MIQPSQKPKAPQKSILLYKKATCIFATFLTAPFDASAAGSLEALSALNILEPPQIIQGSKTTDIISLNYQSNIESTEPSSASAPEAPSMDVGGQNAGFDNNKSLELTATSLRALNAANAANAVNSLSASSIISTTSTTSTAPAPFSSMPMDIPKAILSSPVNIAANSTNPANPANPVNATNASNVNSNSNSKALNPSQNINSDYLEKINRPIFAFNQKIDKWILKPVAQGYETVTPSLIRRMVDNFLGNIDDVYSTANHLLQGNISNAIEGTTRVMINSVLGLGGVMDIATPVNLVKKPQDFGQTLGKWGVPSGPYIVMPVFGPATVRDAAGRIITMQASPTAVMNDNNKIVYNIAQAVNTRVNLLPTTRLLDKVALDPYIMTREAYLQRKAREDKLLKKNNIFSSGKMMVPAQIEPVKLSANALSMGDLSASQNISMQTNPASSGISTPTSTPAATSYTDEELDDGFVVP